MTLDLLSLPWLPFLRRSGAVTWGAPHLLAGGADDPDGADPVVGLSAVRPDFEGAALEFLVGLLTVALRPDTEEEWREWWEHPPSPETLRARLAALPPAFALDGEGPRFFQDRAADGFVKAKTVPIGQLLIDAPGAETAKKNTDLFVKRGRVGRLGPAAAALALLTMQTYSPTGGSGIRTSLRGGGPLTTLVDPRVDARHDSWLSHDQPLWHLLWANVQTAERWEQPSLSSPEGTPAWEHVFPWLLATRTSEEDQATYPSDAHPLQAFFGLPRRIRLQFAGPGRCDLTGREEPRTVVAFQTRPHGVKYDKWQHPLSPHYRAKDKKSGAEMMLPLHGQPGGVGWRDWLGLTLRTPAGEGARTPAAAVAEFLEFRARDVGADEVRLVAFGYDFDNMKARGWVTSAQPAFATPDPAHAEVLADAARRLTKGTELAADALLGAVRRALYASDEVPGDLSAVKGDLWADTADSFFTVMRALADPRATFADAEARCADFRADTARRALAVFDRRCPTSGLASQVLRRLVSARYALAGTLRGVGKAGAKLFGTEGFRLPLDTARQSTVSLTFEEVSA